MHASSSRPARLLALILSTLPLACGGDSMDDGGGSSQDTTPARLEDYCDKCAACFNTPCFSEGFCTPFIMGGKFDTLSCASKGDVAELKTHTLTRAALAALSCPDFDYAE